MRLHYKYSKTPVYRAPIYRVPNSFPPRGPVNRGFTVVRCIFRVQTGAKEQKGQIINEIWEKRDKKFKLDSKSTKEFS